MFSNSRGFGDKISSKPLLFEKKAMLETYKATLRGDKIEWKDDAPKNLDKNKSYDVLITILDDAENNELRPFENSETKYRN